MYPSTFSITQHVFCQNATLNSALRHVDEAEGKMEIIRTLAMKLGLDHCSSRTRKNEYPVTQFSNL